jgi:hypothetical protein
MKEKEYKIYIYLIKVEVKRSSQDIPKNIPQLTLIPILYIYKKGLKANKKVSNVNEGKKKNPNIKKILVICCSNTIQHEHSHNQ